MQENKLKKEENVELLKKLAQSKVDTPSLQSSKELGKRKREDDVSTTPAIDPSNKAPAQPDLSGDESDELDRKLDVSRATEYKEEAAKPQAKQADAGSGLKRPLEVGADGFPLLKKRKRTKAKPAAAPMPEVPWEGFDSEEEGDEDASGADEDEDEASDEGDESKSDEDGDEEGCDDDEDDDGDESEDDDEEEENAESKAPRRSAFKSWAQIGRAHV